MDRTTIFTEEETLDPISDFTHCTGWTHNWYILFFAHTFSLFPFRLTSFLLFPPFLFSSSPLLLFSHNHSFSLLLSSLLFHPFLFSSSPLLLLSHNHSFSLLPFYSPPLFISHNHSSSPLFPFIPSSSLFFSSP